MTYKIGSTQVGLTELSALTVPLPRPYATYQAHSEITDTVDGGAVGRGFPIVVWQFSGLTLDQRDQLRSFCSGVSATVYIETQSNEDEDEFVQLECKMIWPLTENAPATGGRRETLAITFRVLQDVTPT